MIFIINELKKILIAYFVQHHDEKRLCVEGSEKFLIGLKTSETTKIHQEKSFSIYRSAQNQF